MLEKIHHWWKSESTRQVLWVPVCFAAGIALYFDLPSEPARWVFPLLALLSAGGAYALRRRALPVMLALLLAAAGASLAQYTTHAHHPTMLRTALAPRPMIGVVRDIERTQAGVRLLLDNVTVEDLAPELTPKQVRLSVKFKKGAEFTLPNIGDAIHIRAGLMPPMGPALPGGFDFARYFYFRDIGAVGYGLPPWEVLGAPTLQTLEARFWSWRAQLTDRIVRTIGVERGGIAAGLITGDGRAISDADFDALRASNLYHIIAISGEHMVIVSGVIFVGLRLLLLLLPGRLSLRPEGKSILAAITLALVTLYLFITGLPTSAVRAYVMIALVLLAIILRRHVDPMRSLSITAFLMLAYDPAMLLDPGFQLSFAATLALIALVEARVMRTPPAPERGRVRMALHHMLTLVLISVVAEAATAPFAISMFNNFSIYGVFANGVATPLTSLFLMPVVALFFLLLPFGLEGVALHLLSYGIAALLALGRFVASLPHAQIFLPTLPGFGLALFTLGLLWICLWRTRMRRFGLVPAVLGLITIGAVTPPDLLVSSSLKQVAFRDGDGYVLARGRAESMVPQMWANGLGYKELPRAEPPQWRCDGLGCVARIKGSAVAFPVDLTALLEDCAHASLILSSRTPVHCAVPTPMIREGKTLSDVSVTAAWFGDKAPRVETSADWQGNRPWSAHAEEIGAE